MIRVRGQGPCVNLTLDPGTRTQQHEAKMHSYIRASAANVLKLRVAGCVPALGHNACGDR